MANSFVQICVDDKLKDAVTAVYDQLGLDLSTAVRIFFTRSVAENGIPFSMKLGNPKREAVRHRISPDVMAAMHSIAHSAVVNGLTNMSLEEINAEIETVRRDL